jgi:[NiFe] hydrogenase diaphorase moiety large subunit
MVHPHRCNATAAARPRAANPLTFVNGPIATPRMMVSERAALAAALRSTPMVIPDEVAGACVMRHGGDPTRLLQVLRDVQGDLGHLGPEAIDAVARALHLPRVRVEATATFYHLLHAESHGAYEVLFSDNITDHIQGKAELMAYLCERMWLAPEKLSEDGLVYVGSTSDIGLGDQGPAALVNGRPLPALDHNRLDLIAGLIRNRKPLSAWPGMLFEVAPNIRRSDALLSEPHPPGAAVLRVLDMGGAAMLEELERASPRGRGGAGFRTAVKWASCRAAQGSDRCVICNADEGEPGTFKDRALLQAHAELVFDGMTVAARVVRATRGILYLRGEYLFLAEQLERILQRRRDEGLLGSHILGAADFDFDIAIELGAGAYVCGEESALIESAEGKPGRPRNRPPYPVTHGYLGQPTVVNNVETFACAAMIALRGGAWFAAIGTPESTGTKLLSVSGDCARPGVYEYPFGVPVRRVLADCGARHPHAVQVGGPSGTCLSWREFDRRIAFEDVPCAGAFMVFGRERDMFEVARNFTHFFAHESCGFCTPCRVGTALLGNCMDKLAAGKGSAYDLTQMHRLMHIMLTMSHCGLGHTAAKPVVETMEKFPETYERRLRALDYEPAFDVDGALETARQITGRCDLLAHVDEANP